MPARAALVALVAAAAAGVWPLLRIGAQSGRQGPSGEPAVPADVAERLVPTRHPELPEHASQFWLVPDGHVARPRGAADGGDGPISTFARGLSLVDNGEYARALPLLAAAPLAATSLSGYARYYSALAELRLDRVEQAASTLDALLETMPGGYLHEAASMARADAAGRLGDHARALDLLEPLASGFRVSVPAILLRAADAAVAAVRLERAVALYRRLYYDHPLSEEAKTAAEALARLATGDAWTPARVENEQRRAERLFSAGRWTEARDAFDRVRELGGSDRELVALRLAQCDYRLGRFAAARDGLATHLTSVGRGGEARYFHALAIRSLGDAARYVSLTRALVHDLPGTRWAEEALNELASHYIRQDEVDPADRTFRELRAAFPEGRYAERAAWKVGWRAYRDGRFGEAASVFEQAAAAFPRADTRPAWLYWSGRARQRAGDEPGSAARYRLAVADYGTSYYGRLARGRLNGDAARLDRPRGEPPRAPAGLPVSLIQQLIAVGRHQDADRELQYAGQASGSTPVTRATLAWLRHQQGLDTTGRERFDLLRDAITLMKSAYPQYLTDAGTELPREILTVVFPLDYGPLIRKEAAARGLDPWLVAALVSQESTFTADVLSPANAVGLMQVLPETGQRYARRLDMRFGPDTLTRPEANVRIGTTYLRELMDRFDHAHLAVAGYNAGEHRVDRWIAERPGLPQDEFIDDIPFPETQNYVKKVLGMREEYRRIYEIND
ncbi:MAG: tetratricopeptide repeat protein [Acidimicrobiia bacterium]|nr:tetratricopeptide repeat protein [Acidimicrobiia bacterium]